MISVREIAERIGGRVEGDDSLVLRGIAPLHTAGSEDLSFLTNPRYVHDLETTRAPAILTVPETNLRGKTGILHDDPYWALSRILPLFFPSPPPRPGIRPGAFVHETAVVHPSATVAGGAVVGERVVVGERTVLYPGVVVLEDSRVGKDCLFYPNVAVYPRCAIGDRVIIQAGSVIGSDGFGFAFHEERYHKIPQMGGVEIHDDVEIGANTTIDAGTLTPTVIGEGTKIDNLVQVAHNVQIGKHCVLVSMCGISGSTNIGDHCVFAGQTGAVGHLKIGNRVQVTARTAVTKDVPDGQTVSGFPSRDHRRWLRELASLHRLPSLLQKLKGGSDGTED